MNGRWITVPNWDRFQHYRHRNPPWIKNHLRLLHKDEYLELPYSTRGLLHGIWLAYAETEGNLTPADLGPLLGTGERTKDAHRMFVKRSLERLNHAGFVVVSASKSPLYSERSSNYTRAREANNNGDDPFGLPSVEPDLATVEMLHAWLAAHGRP